MDTVFFRRALAAMNRIYTMYLTDIWKYWANSQFQLNDPFSITEEQLGPRILSNLLCFCRTWVIARRYHSYSLCYLLDFRNVYIAAIHFFCGSVIIHRSFWSDPYVKDTDFFTTLFATIHYNKRSVVDLRKFEEYVYLGKAIVALLF